MKLCMDCMNEHQKSKLPIPAAWARYTQHFPHFHEHAMELGRKYEVLQYEVLLQLLQINFFL